MSEHKKRVVGRPFQPGNPGRPKGSRNLISESFLTAMYNDFQEHGVQAIARAREEDALGYVKVVAGLLPQKMEISKTVSVMSDEELLAVIRGSSRGAAEAPHVSPEPGSVVH